MKHITAAVFLAVMSTSCSSGNAGESSTGGFTEHTLTVTDSIGIELGDSNYVFGSIADVEILPDGNFIVLDDAVCNMRIFSPGGNHLRTISNRGEGPGELMHPFSLFNWGDGTISVMDPNNAGIHRYDLSTGQWLGLEMEVNHNIPVDAVVVDDSSWVCFKTRFDVDGERVNATCFIGLFDWDLEPRLTYWERTVPWDPGNMGNLTLEMFFYNSYAIDPETGNVFIAPFSEDSYLIHSFQPDGSPTGTMTAEHTPLPKTPEEIQEESDFVEFFLRQSEANNPDLNYHCDPWPNHLPVTGLFIGPEGDLWARRGGTSTPTFDIWDTATLEMLGTASIPVIEGDGASWQMVFGREYMIAWNENPEDYQKLYLLQYNADEM